MRIIVTLYSTNCPRCKVLEKKMEQAGVSFEVNTSVDDMLALGMRQAPMLKIGDELLDFTAACAWLNNNR